ncbi:MAG TPA: SDR family oxidoreductase [Acidimicrobiales bacterium]|nr:SDR family oxidoreductase [Acidimicrobiales bacterium]
MPVAIVTGASKGLGKALAQGLARQGWSLVLDARGRAALESTADGVRGLLPATAQVRAVAGDVTDVGHRRALILAAEELGGLDLLVNNASTLGASPLPRLVDLAPGTLRRIVEVNTIAPLALFQQSLPLLRRSADPRVLNVTSDASLEHYDSWGGYGSSKAALDHVSATLCVEEPTIRVWAVDPGDMRTEMHQDAFPGEDISDRPLPESVVPALLGLVASDTPGGRIRAAELVPATGGPR